MANIILTSNAQFQPFSYQELAVPIMHQQQVHDAVAEEYDKLSSQADVLEAMAMRDGDSEAYRRYKAFSDSLRNAADRLYTNGLDSQTKLTMHGLKRAYNTEIVPIQHAWAKREQEAKMQQDAWLKDPSLMFSRNAGDTNLDYYMSNPEGGFKVFSKNDISKEAAAVFSTLTNKINSGHTENIDPFTYKLITNWGLNPEMVSDFMNNPDKYPTMANMMNSVLKSHGITVDALKDTPNGESILREGTDAALKGAWAAVGKDTQEKMENYYTRGLFDLEKSKRLLDYKAAAKAAEAGQTTYPDVEVRSMGVGVKTAENYRADLDDNTKGLMQGNRLNGSYFGATRNVNPMKIYEMVQEELKKPEYWERNKEYIRTGNPMAMGTYVMDTNGVVLKSDSMRKAFEKVTKNRHTNSSYGGGYQVSPSDYGVTKLLTQKEYQALLDLGFNSNSDFSSVSPEEINARINNTVKRRTAYDLVMRDTSNYNHIGTELVNQAIENASNLGSKVYERKDDYTLGEGVTSLKDLGIDEKHPEKSAKITAMGYDPRYPGFVVVRINGKRFYVKPEMLGGDNLANDLKAWEAENGEFPENIAAGLIKYVNGGNYGVGVTSSKSGYRAGDIYSDEEEEGENYE